MNAIRVILVVSAAALLSGCSYNKIQTQDESV